MSTYANFDKDVLIFADRDSIAGGLTVGDGHVALLTQGSTLLLRKLFFAAPDTTSTLEELLTSLFPGLTEAEIEETAEHVFKVIPHLHERRSHPSLGALKEAHLDVASTVSVGSGLPTYCPAGTLLKRKVDKQTIYFSISSASLAGAVRPNPSLASVAASGTSFEVRTPEGSTAGHDYLYPAGAGPRPAPHPAPHPHPAPKPHPGPHCGVCGACGACALCAEVNFGAASAAAIALTAAGIVAAELHSKRERMLGTKGTALDASRIDSATKPLLKLAEELND